MDWDGTCCRVALQVLEHGESGVVGQVDVEQHGAGDELLCKAKTLGCGRRHQGAKLLLVQKVAQDAGERGVVLDD